MLTKFLFSLSKYFSLFQFFVLTKNLISKKKTSFQDFMFLFSFMLISIIYITGCSNTPSDEQIFSLRYDHNRGNPLNYKFMVVWNNYSSGYVFIKITPGPSPYPTQEWYIGSLPSSSGTLSSSYSFPGNNPSPTNYFVYAELRSSMGPGSPIATSGSKLIEIKYKKFNVIQLAMVNDNLWPNLTAQQYDGVAQRNAALGDANLIYNVVDDKSGLSNTTDPEGFPIDFSNDTKMSRWAWWSAYGTLTGIDPKKSIICGIDDVSLAYMGNPIDGGITAGFTLPDGTHSVPQLCFVLYSRIKNYYPSKQYDEIRTINGSLIHEIGHAIGIRNDGSIIDPPHSGSNIGACLMLPKNTPDVYSNCLFCAGHIQFISNQNWFLL